MVDESSLAVLVEGLLSAPSSDQGTLHELLSLTAESDGFPPTSFDILTEGNKAADSILAAFSLPATAPYPEKGSVVGKNAPEELPKSVVKAIFCSVLRQPAVLKPTENHPIKPIDIDADVSYLSPSNSGIRIGTSQVDPGNGRRSYQQPQAPHRPNSPGRGFISRPSSSTSAATIEDAHQQPAVKGPFRTAQSKYVQDKRKRGGRSPPDISRRDGGSGYVHGHGTNSRSNAHKDNSRHIRGPDANIRAMTKAVLGKRQRGNSGGVPTRKETSGPSEDIPEIPNVDPKFVEMIMNEMLDKSPGVEWDDIAGLGFAKKCVMEAIVWPMLRPDIFTGLRAPPKGLLMFGPPGTGKTMIGKAIASKSGARFFNISASSLMSKWVGEGEKMVRALFAVAREFQPSVIFIDEIDSLLTQRTESDQEGSRRIKTEFLVQMDGAGTSKEDRVLVVGATNRPQELDEAARRRLVKRLYIPLPDDEARKVIMKSLLKKSKHAVSEDDYKAIVALTKGYSGSDMSAMCAEAALGPIRELGAAIASISESGVRAIGRRDFEGAAKQVRASVSDRDLDGYVEWNKTYGSFAMEPADAGTSAKSEA